MRSSSCLKLTVTFFLLLICIMGMALLSYMRVITYAAGVSHKLSTKTGMTCGAWSVVPSPSPADSNTHYILNGVAAISTNDVWAVGISYYSNYPTTVFQTLIEHWDGTSWSVVLSPNPDPNANLLTAVTAISTNDVWAVGYYRNGSTKPLIEHWDGTNWSIVPNHNPGGSNLLFGVAAVSTNDVWAVGSIIEHWNGTNWSVVSDQIPSNSSGHYYHAVAVDSTNDVWAVGNYRDVDHMYRPKTLTEHWNGTSWSVVPDPYSKLSSNSLSGVAHVLGTTHFWVVGYNHPVTERWNGTKWHITSNFGTRIGALLGVTALAEDNVWAVGNLGIEFEHWNGTSWSIIVGPNPYPGQTPGLNAVTQVPGTTQIWAVGGVGPNLGLIEFYC